MDTPKKIKAHSERVYSAVRTRKSKPYHGLRNVRQTRNIGEGMPPMHEGRAVSHKEYWLAVTSGLAGQMQFNPTKAPDGQALSVPLHDRAQMNRVRFRKLASPWRRDKVN